MQKLFLLGGENVYNRNAKEVNRKAFEDSGNADILVFPWARASFDKKYRKRKLLTDYFLSLSAREITYIDYSEPIGEIEKRMANSTVIYLTGGQPSILIERLKNSGVDKLIKNFSGIIIGRSAGALALCKKCMTTSHSSQKIKIINGLGLADITLKVHYTPKKDAELRCFSLNEMIFAVPERSALIYDDRKLSTMGDVYLFSNGQRQIFSSTGVYQEKL